MSNIVRLHDPRTLDRLWDDYARLIKAMQDDPALQLDRAHVEAAIRAHQRFAHAFTAADEAAA